MQQVTDKMFFNGISKFNDLIDQQRHDFHDHLENQKKWNEFAAPKIKETINTIAKVKFEIDVQAQNFC